jgi:polar amino acid transport system substrate-binding protein
MIWTMNPIRKTLVARLALLTLGTALMVGLAACRIGQSGGAWQRVKQSGVLRVGTDATYPPFEWVDTASGQVEGFDADLVREVCRDMGCRAEFIVTPFDGIIAGLVSSKYDMIASTFTITPERAAHVAFSDPYYDAGQAIAVPVYDTTTRGADDLEGKSIGVQLGTTGERRAGQIKGAHIISFENIGAAFIDMENGRLDAVINDRPTTELIIRQRHAAKIVGPTLTAEKYGLAVTKDDEELLTALNAALAKIKSDGRYDTIRARWFGAPAS